MQDKKTVALDHIDYLSHKNGMQGLKVFFLILGSITLILWSGAVMAGSSVLGDPAFGPMHELLQRRTETTFRYSADRQLNVSEIWQPLWQRDDRLLYLTLRSMLDSLDNLEGNLGLGYRRFMGNYILGGYAYADRRLTALGSDFYQLTLGGEYIGDGYEWRTNLYLPFHPTRTYAQTDAVGVAIAGNGVYLQSPGEVIEEAQTGLDAEMGWTLPPISDFVGAVRVYGGGYYFRGDQTNDVIGARTRVEADVTSWLKLGARAQYDDERGAQYFAEMTLRWPRRSKQQARGLWARMADIPERDVDIVTGGKVVKGDVSPILDQTTGSPVELIYVDNTRSVEGDGTAERPYATLAAALAVAQPYQIIYIAAGDGSARGYNAGYALNISDLQVIGSGVPLVLPGENYTTAEQNWRGDLVLRPAAAYPLVTSMVGDAVTVTATGVTLQGFQIDHAMGHGLVLTEDGDDLTLQEMYITGNAGHGLLVDHHGGSVVDVNVRDTVITGNLLSGIRTATSGGAVALDLGRVDDYGHNDIYGNVLNDLSIQNGGVDVPAQGNFWGDALPGRLAGVDLARIDDAVAVIEPFCPSCRIDLPLFDNLTEVREGVRQISETHRLSGFTGHRYLQVTGDGDPEWVLNGIVTGATVTAVQAGDQIATRFTPSTTGLMAQKITLQGGGNTQEFYAQTRYLPNASSSLIGWWDGHDIDGNFDVTDSPISGSRVSMWQDKTGFGHVAMASGTERPVYQTETGFLTVDGGDDQMVVNNSFYLSALTDGLTWAGVIRGETGGAMTDLFRYGDCTGGVSSRCFSLVKLGGGSGVQVRVDTSAEQNQRSPVVPVLDGAAHLVWVTAGADGQVQIRMDGQNQVSSTYAVGSGFWNTSGVNLVGSINGGYGEVLLFNGVQGVATRDLIENYLSDRWNLTF